LFSAAYRINLKTTSTVVNRLRQH